MIGSTLRHLKNKSVLTIFNNDNNVVRKVVLIIGKEYLVNPINKNKHKHRGRKCILIGISHDGYGVIGKVKFIDTLRTGKVEIDDLDNIN